MELTDSKELVATAASICTILQLLVPIWICRKYIQAGTTGETSSLPFSVGMMGSCMWWRYGSMQGESSLIIVNAIGFILQAGYVGVFYKYAENKKLVLYQVASIAAFLLLILIYSWLDKNPERSLQRVGSLCCIITVAFFAAPLTRLAHVIKHKSAETMPLQLIAMTFITSVLWLIYGVMIHDRFVQIPNVLGTTLSAAQLSLFVIYPPGGGSFFDRGQRTHLLIND